jgi:[protein-PII] uridylyltransferase
MMSITAQKMDISDYRVIEEFAKKVGDHERLDYLYLLTICDIGATNPKLLNPWRLSLINQLYMETSQVFKRRLETSEHWAGRAARKRAKATELLREKGIHENLFLELWNSFGDNYFSKYSAEDICWHTEAIMQHNKPDKPLVIAGLTQESSTQVYTQIFIYMKDCERLFVNSVAVLSELGLNILDARVLTSKGGHTLNTYIVDDDDTGIISTTPQIYRKICQAMEDRLIHRGDLPDPIYSTIPRTHKHFNIQSIVRIHSLIDAPYTVISLETLDRPGLLALIGRIFAQHQLSLHSAKILTFGERAEDFFYVSYQQKRLSCPRLTALVYKDLEAAIAT